MKRGTTVKARVSRVVDGDTIRVYLPNSNEDEAIRILALDTEESHAGGGKPVTPWGIKAKERAMLFFSPNDIVELEFPGNESYEECLEKYRGNYGRLLVYVYNNGVDFQEIMIKEGYSPYFMKYGNAEFQEHHDKYLAAERIAQINYLGVWNQLDVNGSEVRNYASLGVWWRLRAEIIERYRYVKRFNNRLLNTRLDYEKLLMMSEEGKEIIVFTELNSIKRVGARGAVIKIGSQRQPFTLYVPDIESEEGQSIARLLESRYLVKDEHHPSRSYAYVSGQLSLYRGKPQIRILRSNQILDEIYEKTAKRNLRKSKAENSPLV